MSIDSLIGLIREKRSPTVLGLDPKLEYIPQYIIDKAFKEHGRGLSGAAAAILEFNRGLIDALYDIVPAVKPQSAYYEMYGLPGLAAMHETISYAKSKGLYVILDVKRGDIGSTAQAYSSAYIGETDVCGEKVRAFCPDGVTVNGYLGSDGVMPFIDDCNRYGKSIFVLVKTSNPSSGELQDLTADGAPIYEKMARMVNRWAALSMGRSGYSNVGCVAGATYPEQLKRLRSLMPGVFFLVPGYGAQGGGAGDVAAAFDRNGLGAVINSSRAIMCAYKTQNADEKAYAEAARHEALKMKNEILKVIGL